MNKSLLLTICFIAVLFNTFKAQSSDALVPDSLKLVTIKQPADSLINHNETIGFSIVNETDETLYFSLSLEEKMGGLWIVLMEDLYRHEKDRYGAKNIRILSPVEEKTYRWNPDSLFLSGYKPTGLCRFVFLIKESPFNGGKTVYSDSFLID